MPSVLAISWHAGCWLWVTSMDSQAKELEEGQHIAAVLSAERQAEEAVERAKLEAQGIVEHAREKARRIRARTDRRIAALSARASAVTEQRIEALRAEEAERRRRLSLRVHDSEVIRAAVQRVADWLLGSGT
jgi:vacuolar-type H+-ATPase subunit H